jgi:hypothetical protein
MQLSKNKLALMPQKKPHTKPYILFSQEDSQEQNTQRSQRHKKNRTATSRQDTYQPTAMLP